MRYLPRELERQVTAAAKGFPSVVLTGPRRSVKTLLPRYLPPKARYYLLEDPNVVARFRHDPQGLSDAVKTPAILDEIQHETEVSNYSKPTVRQRPNPHLFQAHPIVQ